MLNCPFWDFKYKPFQLGVEQSYHQIASVCVCVCVFMWEHAETQCCGGRQQGGRAGSLSARVHHPSPRPWRSDKCLREPAQTGGARSLRGTTVKGGLIVAKAHRKWWIATWYLPLSLCVYYYAMDWVEPTYHLCFRLCISKVTWPATKCLTKLQAHSFSTMKRPT